MELIESYDFGRNVIDDTTYTNDVITRGERIQGSWWRKEGRYRPLFHATDVEEVLERFEPELIVIGTGYPGMMNV